MAEIDIKNIFSKKEMCYFVMVDKFFKKCPQSMITKMINIINCEDDISLRILDWFVTRYAKKGIDFTRDNDVFDVHINYKAQLKSYKKKYFDPFRRKYKFDYTFVINGEKKVLKTTIGQLNFFAWAISNNIITYVNDNLQQITKAMNLSNKEDKKIKEQKKKNKNTQKSTSDDEIEDDIEDDIEDEDEIEDEISHDSNDLKDIIKNNDDTDTDSEKSGISCVSNVKNLKPNNNNLSKDINPTKLKNVKSNNNFIISSLPDEVTKNKNFNKDSLYECLSSQKNDFVLKTNKQSQYKNKKNSVNINASHKIDNDEVELTLSFD